jgi:hypothetical protein
MRHGYLPWTLRLPVEFVIAHSSLWFDLRANVQARRDAVSSVSSFSGWRQRILNRATLTIWPEITKRPYVWNGAFGTLAVAFVVACQRPAAQLAPYLIGGSD